MKTSINLQRKILLAGIFLLLAVIGLMIKLPVPFRHIDKEMHFAFFFGAAGFMNLLFAKNNIFIHAIIFIFLHLFGIFIEYAQAYSNRFFTSRIHGNFDPEDVAYNLRGLVAFSVIWLLWLAFYHIYYKQTAATKSKK